VVRLTGDCPLIDPEILDRVVDAHLVQNNDYTSNIHPPTYPDGLDVEICKFSCLEEAVREAKKPSEREHVTPFFYTQPKRFKIGNVTGPEDLSAFRWTVDQAEDFDLVETIYKALYPANPAFGLKAILAFLKDQPALSGGNQKFKRNEGYKV
jgi:spore coat polysaccharide biosynthesis protein SpsF